MMIELFFWGGGAGLRQMVFIYTCPRSLSFTFYFLLYHTRRLSSGVPCNVCREVGVIQTDDPVHPRELLVKQNVRDSCQLIRSASVRGYLDREIIGDHRMLLRWYVRSRWLHWSLRLHAQCLYRIES